MPPTTIEIKCCKCNKRSTKRLAEINFQQRRYESKGYTGTRPVFCSKRCGQSYSGEVFRNNIGTVETISRAMKSRELKNYEHLLNKSLNVIHEHCIENRIYDLFLPDHKIVIEFDGVYHSYENQKIIDKEKNEIASRNGLKIIRLIGDPKNYTIEQIKEFLCQK